MLLDLTSTDSNEAIQHPVFVTRLYRLARLSLFKVNYYLRHSGGLYYL